ncbi:MAG: SulP family inorganic anion transporter [Flavobacteriaceae bacterium]
MKHLFSNLRGDFFGGITAGIVALPLALAFGVASGLGPSAGLYGAIFISFFAALFGGTSTQISGPTAPMTALSTVVIAGIIAANNGEVNKALPAILTVFLFAGIFQIVLGSLGLGKYIRYIPYPVVSGFMTAIGLMIIISQFTPSLGYQVKEDTQFVEQFEVLAEQAVLKNILDDNVKKRGVLTLRDFQETINQGKLISSDAVYKEAQNLAKKEASGVLGALKILPRMLQKVNWLEFLLTLSTIFIIYGFKKITTKIPSSLVALVVVSGIAVGLNLNYASIEEIPTDFPMPNIAIFSTFELSSVSPYIFTALTLALLGSIDSLLTSVVADNMTKTKHKPNRELIGQGIGNSIASIFGGIPGAGATIRTVVNINAGGKTKLSGMIAGIMLLVVLLGLGSVASKIPQAVLAGILVTVGIGVIDYKGLKAISSLPKDLKVGPLKLSSEVLIMFIVMILATFWDLIYAVGIGLVFASLIFMKKTGDLTAQKSTIAPLDEDTWDDEKEITKELKNTVFVKHINGPLFFGFTSEFQQLSKQIPSYAHTIVIRMDRMPYMDQSGLYALEDMLVRLRDSGKTVLFVGPQQQPRFMMERIDIIPDLIEEERIFKEIGACIQWIKKNNK